MAVLGWLVMVVAALAFSAMTFAGLMLKGRSDAELWFLGICALGLWSGVVQLAPFTLTFV